MSKNMEIGRKFVTKIPLLLGAVVFATVLGVGLSNANNTYADEITEPETSSGISIVGAVQLCKEQYDTDGASYGNGTILCGDTEIGVWSAPEPDDQYTNPDILKIQQLLDTCQKYTNVGNNKVITFKENGDVTCGSDTVLAKWSEADNGYIDILYIPDTSSGISISGLIELCKKDYNIDGATFTADGNMSCGDNNVGTWGAIEDRVDSQDVLDVCIERYGISDKIVYLANGNITCGGYTVATWDKDTEDITILPAPAPSTGGSSTGGGNKYPDTSSTDAIKKELQSLIDEIKNNPLYRLYSKLIEIVKRAEELLADTDVSNATEYAMPEQKPDQPYVVRYASADKQSYVVLANTNTSELVNAIQAIGNALRDLGVNTDLGVNITTANTDDLRHAIVVAKNTAKYDEYAKLAATLERAETALTNGTFNSATLAELAAAKTAVGQQSQTPSAQAPDTGINATKGFASATATIAVAVIASVVVAGVSFIVVKKRFATTEK